MNIGARPWCVSLGAFSFAFASVMGCKGDGPTAPGSDGGKGSGGRTGTGDAGAGATGAAEASIEAGSASRIIALADGKLRGEVAGGVQRFRGIPYAKPPVGGLRWQAPEKNDPWSGVRDATQFGPGCAQYADEGRAAGKEDCLYLNVWAPEVALARPAPVLVWIHGGGHQNGASSDHLPPPNSDALVNDGSEFAARGVVVVTIDYRLGPLGFFAQPDLTADGAPRGNQGLLDQRRALEWVRDNIAAFGGDPDNVTIAGQSSGSVDVCNHMVSPGSSPLFHRAVSESGGCTARKPTADEAEHEVSGYVAAVGCSGAASVATCLRNKSADELMRFPPSVPVLPASGDGGVGSGAGLPGGPRYDGTRLAWWFGPVVEGSVLPDQPSLLFARNAAHGPYLIGANADEGVLFHLEKGVQPVTTEAEYEAALHRRFGGRAEEILRVYPAANFDSPEAAIRRVTGDFELVCETNDSARRAADAGLDVYSYDFSVAIDLAQEPGTSAATHGLEIPFIWGDGLTFMRMDRNASHLALQGYWARFAKNGDPNGSGALAWPTFNSADDERLQFDTGIERVVTGYRANECALWRTFYDSFDPGRPGSGDVTP